MSGRGARAPSAGKQQKRATQQEEGGGGGGEPSTPARKAAKARQQAPPPTPSRARSVPDPPPPELLAKAQRISRQLAELYPSPPIPLAHGDAFQLLVAVMLSAQATDRKVNEVTPALFSAAPDATALAAMEVPAIQAIIQPIGLAPTKARNLNAMSKLLLERHAGKVPGNFADLEALPGVGHKTASVVLSQAFGLAALPVDTHIHRLATRWRLSEGRSVEQVEADLKALLPEHTWHDFHLQVIYFGREHCPAKKHDPQRCPICSWAAAGEEAAAAGSSGGRKPASGAAAAGMEKSSALGSRKRVAPAPVAAAAAAPAGAAAGSGGSGAEARPRRRSRRQG